MDAITAKTSDAITADMYHGLVDRLDKDPTLYLDEMKEYFADEFGISVSISTISKKLKRENDQLRYTMHIYINMCIFLRVRRGQYITI